MPGGVQTRFLQVLDLDQELLGRRVLITAIMAAIVAIPSFLLGGVIGIGVYVGALGLGLLLGLLISRKRASGYEDSIKARWKEWMRFSLACETLSEIFARVQGGNTKNRATWIATGLTGFWAIEMLLITIALGSDPHLLEVLPMIIFNGLVAGGLLGFAIHRRKWQTGLRASVKDLLESGEIGVWGVM